MKSIFLRIYIGVIGAAMILLLLAYIALDRINQYRYEDYLSKTIGGTFSLITAGITRHQGDEQKRWIGAVERLTGLPLRIDKLDNLEDYRLYQLSDTDQVIYINANIARKQAQVALRIPGSTDEFILSQLKDINQSVTRASAILILNELGRHAKQDRSSVLKKLGGHFGYDLNLLPPRKLNLDSSQLRQLARGDVVVRLNDTLSDTPFIQVYAKYGNSGHLLVLGPLMIFRWYPISLLLIMTLAGLALLFVFGYFLVYPLERKLKALERGIQSIGTSNSKVMKVDGRDAFSGITENINQMIQRIDSLVNQQRQLTNDISHELRTPVARMLFRLENLVREHQLDESSRDILGLKKDFNTINTMIDEILTCASFDHAQGFSKTSVNVVSAVSEIVDEVSQQHRSIEILLSKPDVNGLVAVEPTLFKRAIENLLLNACRHCDNTVSIDCKQHHDHFEISIEDDGAGIAEKDQKRVFSPFVRLDSSRHRSGGGFGLGLSIVEKVVHLHRGSIKADTSHILGGAKFCMRIPIELG